MASIKKPPLLKWLVLELVLLALVVTTALLLEQHHNGSYAVSCLLGGLVAIVPHVYFAGYAWRYTGARATPLIAKAFFRGESGKFILTLVGFGLIFVSALPVMPTALFATYCLFLALQIGLAAKQANVGH